MEGLIVSDFKFRFVLYNSSYSTHNVFTFQDEYVSEGIEWRNVEFVDNSACLDLICGRPTGLLNLIDEESRLVYRHTNPSTVIPYPTVPGPSSRIHHNAFALHEL